MNPQTCHVTAAHLGAIDPYFCREEKEQQTHPSTLVLIMLIKMKQHFPFIPHWPGIATASGLHPAATKLTASPPSARLDSGTGSVLINSSRSNNVWESGGFGFENVMYVWMHLFSFSIIIYCQMLIEANNSKTPTLQSLIKHYHVCCQLAQSIWAMWVYCG